MYPKSLYSVIVPSANSIGNVLFDDGLAAYYTVVEVDIISFEGLSEADKTAKFKEAYSSGIKLIAKEDRKSVV